MRYRNRIDYLSVSKFDEGDVVADKDNVEIIIDDIERDVVAIRENLEVVQGLDYIDGIIEDLKALENRLIKREEEK